MTGGEILILMAIVALAWIVRAEGKAADRHHEEQMKEIQHQGKLLKMQHDDLARLIVNGRRD